MKIYTRTGDDGTTGLFYGGRVRKDDPAPEAYGAVDEAQAAIGLARAESEPGGELDVILVAIERDLWVLMAELATSTANRAKLVDGTTRVTEDMVDALEALIDETSARYTPAREFVVPGQTRQAALLDVARTVVRRAERRAVAALAVEPGDALPVRYLNRLSDLLFALARWQEGQSLEARNVGH